jgi:hypothetical protein
MSHDEIKKQGEPIAGTNTTITNPFALWIERGNVNLKGTNLSIGSGNAQGATFRSIFDVIKLGSSSSIYSNNNGAQALYLSANSYNNTSGVDTYTASAAASLIQISSLGLKLYTAPTGTAGNPIAFTNVLGVDLSGNVTGTSFITSGGTVRLSGYTVATLPAGTVGDTAYVTDALAPTFGAAVVGGGAVVIPVFKNATTWVSY